MTNPTSYTDEQVLEHAEWQCITTKAMILSLLADRQRPQAELGTRVAFIDELARRIDAITPPGTMSSVRQEYWKAGARAVIRAINGAIDATCITANETKEAKS